MLFYALVLSGYFYLLIARKVSVLFVKVFNADVLDSGIAGYFWPLSLPIMMILI